MRLPLKQFQEDAVTSLVRHIRTASKESRNGDLQSVCLSSTTGSGKTVMLTSAIELILQGDDDYPSIEDATFLWITDQPELNEQTRRKMIDTSSILGPDRLRVIDSSFDQEMLGAGVVHFLNTQKIGKEKTLVTSGDKRTFTIWQSLNNTITARPGRVFVILDEAHRGMIEESDEAEAASIAQKFIKGSPGELLPVPLVVGISATPERFEQLIKGTNRTRRSVDVDVAEVRASGLIKDTIVLHHPKREQPADMTMLREAARALKKFTTQWSAYCAKYESTNVVPLLIVQVEDSTAKGQLSETDIAQALQVLRDEIPELTLDSFAHAFQEGTALSVGGETLRYLAPSDIQDDPAVRIVFFKTSLNTGWDCPRAEVIMSFRSASDATYIAQLVGRMVRSPLARRIVGNEALNTVALYLPHYDDKGLARIITRLSKPDAGSIPVDVEQSENVVELSRAAGSEEVFRALSILPSYIVPRKRKASQVRRLLKLARLLTNDDLDEGALASAKKALLAILDEEYATRKSSARFRQIVEERGSIDIEAVNWEVGTEEVGAGGTVKVDIAAENIDDLFEASGRKLNEGLHKAWWRNRARNSPLDRERAKLELFALCIEPDVIRRIEKTAQDLVQKWLSQHRAAIAALDEETQGLYNEIRNLAARPELSPLVYPSSVQGRRGKKVLTKHVYVDEAGEFTADLNKTEVDTVSGIAADPNVVGWLRNPDRKIWSLCVPYVVDGEDRAMYPDFVVVRREGKRLVVDLVDPHTISLADAPDKASGLAKFASQHADRFGRIQLVLVDGTASKSLDLTDEAVRNKVRAITLPAQLRQLFQES